MVRAPDAGGFTCLLPAEGEIKDGTLVLGADTFDTHVNILADSGVTYLASWFDLPLSWRAAEQEVVLDSLWKGFSELVGGSSLGPLSAFENSTVSLRHGSILDEKGIRLSLVVRRVDDRIVLMTAGYPEKLSGEWEELKVMRFLHSFKAD